MGPSGSGIHDCIGIGHPASCTDLQYHRHPQLKLYRNLTVLVQFGMYAIISNFKTLSRIKEYPNKVAFHSFYRFKIQSTKILKTNSFFFEYQVWVLTMADFWEHWRLIFLFRDGGIELGGGAVVWWIVVRNRLQTLAVWMVLISSAVWGISHIIQSLHGFCYCSISTWKQNEKFNFILKNFVIAPRGCIKKYFVNYFSCITEAFLHVCALGTLASLSL